MKKFGKAVAFLFSAMVTGWMVAVASAADMPGVTATEIRIGQTMPYSGPASGFSTAGKIAAGYFRKINDEGGINGRKITFLTVDDGYSPPKTVEQTRKLVESDDVLLMFGSLGTSTNAAVQKYLNSKKIPQLFIATGATRWQDYNASPWTIAWIPSYRTEARIMARYAIEKVPNAKVAVLYQGDDLGRDYLKAFEETFAGTPVQIVAKLSYDVTDPTVDSQIVSLAASGANVFYNIASPKFAAQAIRKVREIGWTPTQFVSSIAVSIASVLRPAGLDNATGLLSLAYLKTTFDPQYDGDPGMRDYLSFMSKYVPDGDLADTTSVMGYSSAQTLVHVLKSCGDDFSRENVLAKATSLKDLPLPMLLPGIKISSSPTDYILIKKEQLRRFNGKSWESFGELIEG